MSPLDIFDDEAFNSVILKFQNLFTKKSKKNQKESNKKSSSLTVESFHNMQFKSTPNLSIDTDNNTDDSSDSSSSCSSSPSSSSTTSSSFSNSSTLNKKKRNKPNLTIKTSNITTNKRVSNNVFIIPQEHHLTEHLSGDIIQDVFLDWVYSSAYSKFY